MMKKDKIIFYLILVFLILKSSPLNAQGYIIPKGCLNCPPHPIKEKLEVSFFYEKGDLECLRVQKLLETLSVSSGSIVFQMRDISLSNNREIFDMLVDIYQGGREQSKKVPAIFTENRLFVGYRDIYNNFYLPLISEIEKESSNSIRDWLSKILRRIKLSIINASEGLLSVAVVTAGLIDGINPCAISILIFFIFSVSKLENTRNLILPSGISFILGVFLAYLLIGMGLLKLLTSHLLVSIYNWIFTSMGVLAFSICGISLLDFYYAKKKETRKIKLQLPLSFKKISHSLIRTVSAKNLPIVFGIGILMSIIEFPCSGQVYLPTITLIGNPLSSLRPFLFLLLYNLMFILPLIVIVVLSILWTSSERISSFVSKYLPATKLLTAILFFLLGIYMLIFP